MEDKKEEKKPSHSGHRQRMHERVATYGLDNLNEHEILEYLLYFTNQRKDTNLIAHALVDHFGSLAGALEASEEELCKVEGVGPASARLLHILPETARCYMKSRVSKTKRMEDVRTQSEYIKAQFYGMREERMLLLALDDRHVLMRSIWMEAGTINGVNISLHKVATEAIRSGAAEVILAHNHPGGLVFPSHEDIVATGEIMRALGLLGIPVLDHIIVAGDKYCSMRETKRLPFYNMRTGELQYSIKKPEK